MSLLDQIGLYESEDKKKKTFKLYVDLDGVFCDFEKAFDDLGKELTKGLGSSEFEDKYGTDAFWKLITGEGKLKFWSEMVWTPDGKKLWNYVKKFNPTILTKPAISKYSTEGKKIWIDRELGKKIERILTRESKSTFANINSILIDDNEKNIKDWIESDGIGIIFKSSEQTIEELKKLGM